MKKLLIGAAALTASPVCAQTVIKTDGQWESEGQYMIFASPWCRMLDTSLRPGRDYINSISWQAGTMPSNVQLTWRWPSMSLRPPRCGVYGYNHVAWGNYDGGNTRASVSSKQVGRISALNFTYGIDYAANTHAFNGLIEFYLTYNAGRADQKAVEVGWLWNVPPATATWLKTVRQVGVHNDRYGKSWNVAISYSGSAHNFIIFTPRAGTQAWGRIDGKGALDWLRGRGLVSGAWWFNGAAIGVEPLGGFGTAVVRRWVPTYG